MRPGSRHSTEVDDQELPKCTNMLMCDDMLAVLVAVLIEIFACMYAPTDTSVRWPDKQCKEVQVPSQQAHGATLLFMYP